jgi:hypothetical protein
MAGAVQFEYDPSIPRTATVGGSIEVAGSVTNYTTIKRRQDDRNGSDSVRQQNLEVLGEMADLNEFLFDSERGPVCRHCPPDDNQRSRRFA